MLISAQHRKLKCWRTKEIVVRNQRMNNILNWNTLQIFPRMIRSYPKGMMRRVGLMRAHSWRGVSKTARKEFA